MVSRVPSPPTLPSAPVLTFAESGKNRIVHARHFRAASRQSKFGFKRMTSGPLGTLVLGFLPFTLVDKSSICSIMYLLLAIEMLKKPEGDAPLYTKLVERSDKRILETVIFIVA